MLRGPIRCRHDDRFARDDPAAELPEGELPRSNATPPVSLRQNPHSPSSRSPARSTSGPLGADRERLRRSLATGTPMAQASVVERAAAIVPRRPQYVERRRTMLAALESSRSLRPPKLDRRKQHLGTSHQRRKEWDERRRLEARFLSASSLAASKPSCSVPRAAQDEQMPKPQIKICDTLTQSSDRCLS